MGQAETDPLAGKSDAEIRRLLWRAAARRGDALWVVPLGLALGAAAAAALIGWQIARITAAALGVSATAPTAPPVGAGAAATPGLPPSLRAALVVVTLGVFGLTWVVVRRFMVLRTVRRMLNRVACPFCGFSLVGLRPSGAYVTCPECGERFDLYAHGLSREDLLTEAEKRRPFAGAGRFGAYRAPARTK